MSRVRLEHGTDELQRLRAALELPKRHAPSVAIDLPHCEEAALFWSERAWAEYAAVPAMAQVLLALVREESNLDAAASVTRISHDEVLHTELSRGLAHALGGYVEEVPQALPYNPLQLADGSTSSAASWLLNTAVSETVSFELMGLRLKHTRHPLVHAALARILRDEAVHARIGWSLFESLAPRLQEHQRRDLSEQAENLFESLGSTFATAGLPADARRDARKLREVTAERGLGAAPADEEDALCVDVLERVVVPRLARAQIR